MKLKKFKKLNNKKVSIVIFTVACILLITGVFIYRSFALFESIENKNLIEGNVEDLGDISFTYYLDGNIVKDSPSKDSNYMFDDKNSSCTNNATVRWNYEDWGPVVGNLSNTKTKCHLKFTSNYHERILNGAYPVLEDPLIPVTIEDNGTVKKADLTQEWYNYTNKKWANAVIRQNSYDALSQRGSVHGATKQDGYVSFDGIDDYIDLGLTNYDFQNSITMVMRISLSEYTSEVTPFLNHEASGAGFSFRDGKLYFEFYLTEQQKWIGVNTTFNSYDTVHTIVGTYDGNFARLYIDQELVGETPTNGNIKISPVPFLLGANPDLNGSHTKFTNMNVYQAAIYNRALTEEEIKENFSNDIKIKNNEGLLSYIDFTNKEYEANEIIQEDNIESYFVWIPRYRYKIFNDGNYLGRTAIENRVQTIEVEFESKDTIPSTGSSVGSFLTHPAFTSFNTNGIWVGKFETGTALTSDFNVRNGKAVQVKANISSWRYIQPSNAFYTSYDYQRNLESHMMKNTEWGAVAYLSHSKYGNEGSIRNNNNLDFATGFSAVSEPTCGYTASNETCNKYGTSSDITLPYNTTTGYLANTTGNISGIYDMSGGAWEYVMGIMLDENGNLMSGRNNLNHSGFNGILGCPNCDGGDKAITSITNGYEWPDKRYYDTYSYSTNDQHFERRILGDATGEVGPFASKNYNGSNGKYTRFINSWYDDFAQSVHDSNPWVIRGGHLLEGTDSGIFAFSVTMGSLLNNLGFRVVLSPGGTR